MRAVLIAYGSETGTAQDVAESLWREARLQKVPARLLPLDEYHHASLPDEAVAVFVVATSGQGELPGNMRTAWRALLRKSLASHHLATMRFAVLGLGDSSYQKYNFAGKKLYRRLLQLGAKPVCDLGLADDQHELGIDGALVPWKEQLWASIHTLGIYPEMDRHFEPGTLLPARYALEYVDGTGPTGPQDGEFVRVRVNDNRRVTSETHFQDTRLISFSNEGHDETLKYSPGDVLMVHPANPEETVRLAIECLQYTDEQLDRPFRLAPTDECIKLPPRWIVGEVTTLRECLSRLFDLQVIPKRSFFEVLGSISGDAVERERLLELGSPKGLDDLLDYSNRARRTTAEALQDFYRTSPSIPPERLFDLFSTIRARAFSIASSPSAEPGNIRLLVAKVEYKARMAEPRRGLCSTFIARLRAGDRVSVRVRGGTFKWPSVDKPLLCVGPGTGVAPFRSVLTERHCTASPLTHSLLFFGCRGKNKDYYFKDEWPSVETTRVYPAFSRQPGMERTYVQDVIAREADAVWAVLEAGGSMYVAGSAGDMPKEVCAAVSAVASSRGEGDDFVDRLEKQGRLQFETWS